MDKVWEMLQGTELQMVNIDHTRGLIQVINHIIDPHFVKNSVIEDFDEPELSFEPFFIKSHQVARIHQIFSPFYKNRQAFESYKKDVKR